MVVHATYMYSEWLGYVLQMSPYIPPRQKLQNPNELLMFSWFWYLINGSFHMGYP